jgi:hypothetical protein
MTRYPFAILTAAACLIFTASASAADGGAPRWYKGNLHTHSLWSDGNDFPEMICDWYAARGYHFLALSDHNILSQGEKWMKVQDINRRLNVHALATYEKRFGKEWVQVRGEGAAREVRLRGLDEFRSMFEKPGVFLLIQSEEITDKFGSLPIHINATNIQELIKPQGGQSVRETIQRNLEAVQEQSKRTGQPILPHLNHPNFGYGVSAEDLAAVLPERFFEVYNGHPGVNQTGDPSRAGIDRLWDIANTLRIVEHKSPPLMGIGTDDSHHYHALGTADAPVPAGAIKRSEPGRGWVMVRAAKLDPATLIAAMIKGDFYASSGVTLKDVTFDGKTLAIEIQPRNGVEYTTDFIGTRKGVDLASTPATDKNGKEIHGTRRYSPDIGATLAQVNGHKPTYQLKGDELYVRAVVRSNKSPANPSYVGQVEQAWTQPVGWAK